MLNLRWCPRGLSLLPQAAKLRAAPHHNIVTMYESFTVGINSFLPMELCEGDLFGHVERSGPLSEPAGRALFSQVVAALVHSHSVGVYHGDVKPENILLSRGVPKLTDFGSAGFARFATRSCATVLYGSPESVAVYRAVSSGASEDVARMGRDDSARSDVWSLGVSIVASLTSFMPWEAAEPSDARYHHWMKAFEALGEGEAPLELARRMFWGDESVSASPLLHLLCGMLHPNPARRLTMEAVAAHTWFTAC